MNTTPLRPRNANTAPGSLSRRKAGGVPKTPKNRAPGSSSKVLSASRSARKAHFDGVREKMGAEREKRRTELTEAKAAAAAATKAATQRRVAASRARKEARMRELDHKRQAKAEALGAEQKRLQEKATEDAEVKATLTAQERSRRRTSMAYRKEDALAGRALRERRQEEEKENVGEVTVMRQEEGEDVKGYVQAEKSKRRESLAFRATEWKRHQSITQQTIEEEQETMVMELTAARQEVRGMGGWVGVDIGGLGILSAET